MQGRKILSRDLSGITKKKHTFKLATRSAVSSRVNVLIWSTIWEILGFVAAVDSQRRLLGVRRAVRYGAEVAMRREDGRTEPESCLAQRAAAWVVKDMAEVRMRSGAPEMAGLEESGGDWNRGSLISRPKGNIRGKSGSVTWFLCLRCTFFYQANSRAHDVPQ
jgi:hypothetical protein